MIQVTALFERMKEVILPQYQIQTGVDGAIHAKHTALFGFMLAHVECPEKIDDVVLGCLLHDIGRVPVPDSASEEDYRTANREHGRAGVPISSNILEGNFPSADKSRILYAVENHNRGLTSQDPVVGCIWDADRLGLFRVEKMPSEKLLSTKTGVLLIDYALSFIKAHKKEYE